MKKRILSLLLTAIMLISAFATFTIPAAAASISFTVNPVVLIGGGGEYNIVWENNMNGIGYVTYKFDGKTYTVYDEENGVVRSDDKTHTVRVPQEHLDKAGAYTVYAQAVSSRDGYNIITGNDKAQWSSVFHGYSGKDKVTIGCTSDTHLIYKSKSAAKYNAMLSAMKTAVEVHMQRPDIVLLNGDITNELIHVEEYYALFEMIRIAGSDGQYPVLYVVGNHEKRGYYSKEIEKYLCYDTGEFYTYFEYGPMAAYVVDIGEDKEDSNASYTNGADPIGMIDMERYFDEELKYFENHPGYSDDATYTFTISHGPAYVGNSLYAASPSSFASVFKNYGADLHLAGHTHRMQFNQKTSVLSYPMIMHAAPANGQEVRSMLMTMENGKYTCKGMDVDGTQLWLETVDTEANGSPAPKAEAEETKEEVIEETVETPVDETTAIPTMAGISTAAVKGAADTTSLITKPVVFDAGEYYSIVFQTTSGIKCAGYVDVAGVSKTFMDQHGGKLRTETTHSVRIPKETMSSGKKYTIKARVVTNYNGYGANSSVDNLTFGNYANGTATSFAAQPSSKTSKYTILAVANKTASSEEAQKVISKYKSTPNLVVLAGDMVSNLNTEKDFGKLLEYANTLTKGACPVMLLRGENETKGAFAAYLPRILHSFTSTYNINRLYTTYTVGKLSVIGLDTATNKADSDNSYNGFANFDSLRKEQADWMENKLAKSFAGDYNIVFANASNLTNVVGTDLSKGLERHKVQLVVSAGSETKFVDGGKYYSQATVGDANALVITCKDEEIKVEALKDDLAEIGTVDTTAVTYTGGQTAPPIEDNKGDTPNNNGGESDDDNKDDEDDNNGSYSEDDDDEDDDNNGSYSDDDGDDDNSSNGSGSYESVDDGSFDGSLFVDDVEEGWYYDYLNFDVSITDADITLSGEVTEAEFIYVVARCAGVNATRKTAPTWAENTGIFSGTLGDNAISQDTANSIVKAMFAL